MRLELGFDIRGRRRGRSELHAGENPLAALVVGDCVRRGFLHPRVAEERDLDLVEFHAVSAGLDLAILPPQEGERAVGPPLD